MANLDAPFGLRPVRYASGHAYTGAANRYRKEASTIIGIGDPVVRTGTASTAGTNNADTTGVPLVDRAAAGSGTITGVVVAIEKIDSGTGDRATDTKHMAAADTGYLLVADDPNLIFECQEDGAMAVTAVGEAADLATVADADTNTGLSKIEIDSSNAGTGDQLKILRLANRPDNELGANAVWEVMINEHTDKAATTMI